MKSDALMSEAKSNAKSIIEKAEANAREVIEGMQDQIKQLQQSFQSLENYRDNLLSELKNLSNDTLEKVEKLVSQKKYYELDEFRQKAKELAQITEDFAINVDSSKSADKKLPKHAKEETSKASNEDEDQSFFDQIG